MRQMNFKEALAKGIANTQAKAKVQRDAQAERDAADLEERKKEICGRCGRLYMKCGCACRDPNCEICS